MQTLIQYFFFFNPKQIVKFIRNNLKGAMTHAGSALDSADI